MTCIFDLLNIDDDDIIHSALEALIEIIKVNFKFMEEYLDVFVHLTTALVSKNI